MLSSSLFDYSDAYILVSRTVTITGSGNDDAARELDEKNKGVKFKDCTTCTDWISQINNTIQIMQLDNAKYVDVVIPMYNLVEYSDNYSKASEHLWQHYKDAPNDNIAQSESFKY